MNRLNKLREWNKQRKHKRWLRHERYRKARWLQLRWARAKVKHRQRATTIMHIGKIDWINDDQYTKYRDWWLRHNEKLNAIGDKYKLWSD